MCDSVSANMLTIFSQALLGGESCDFGCVRVGEGITDIGIFKAAVTPFKPSGIATI